MYKMWAGLAPARFRLVNIGWQSFRVLMRRWKSILTSGAFAVSIVSTAIIASSGSASAYIASNRWGDCWHVRNRAHYPAMLGIHFYSDSYRVRLVGPRHHWREYRGRGYWYHGRWHRW